MPVVKTSFWKQPFLHFIVLGGLIFLWDSVKAKSPSPDSNKIVVTATDIERIAKLWEQTWGRIPTDEELHDLVQDNIKEEIYYREAKRLGLDLNDIVIKRRLRQKMEFLSSDDATVIPPSDDKLRMFYNSNIDNYVSPKRYNIDQIFYEKWDEARLKADLEALKGESRFSNFGDKITLPESLKEVDRVTISRVFGTKLYEQLKDLRESDWQGPVKSGFGYHLIRFETASPQEILPFESVRNRVEVDWRGKEKRLADEVTFQKLLKTYKVEIEGPKG